MQVTQSGTVPLRATTQSDAIDGDAVDATLAAAGDPHAFERLYRRHLGRIHSLVRRMIGDDAEDVTQEIFIRTWQKLSTFRGDSAFGTWLHRLALNLILTRRESLGIKRQRHTDDPESLDRMPGRNLPAGFTLDVEAAIQRLPDGARQILVLARHRRIPARGNRRDAEHHERNVEVPAAPRAYGAASHARARPGREREAMTHLTERLSDYLDGSLSPSEREEVERHLAECEECANTLADLRGVVARVQALNDRPPAGDLWPGIAAFIGEGELVRPLKRSRRVVFTVPQLLAAAIALMLLSAGGVTWFLRGHAAEQPQGGTPAVIPRINTRGPGRATTRR